MFEALAGIWVAVGTVLLLIVGGLWLIALCVNDYSETRAKSKSKRTRHVVRKVIPRVEPVKPVRKPYPY